MGFAVTISEISPTHSRPFLLPQYQQQYLLNLIDTQAWAKESFEELTQKADQGDGYSAAFLYALTQKPNYLSTAKSWLLEIARQGGKLGERALNADDSFYNQGMPWLGDVYYDIYTAHLEAFDYIYNGLSAEERLEIESGFSYSAQFRKRAMDTWWQTPNLVFKPTSMVAIHGLVTQNPEFLNWGFFRKPNSNLGGYFSSLNNMLKDNGPWNEAPIYAVLHKPLAMSLQLSDYLSRLTNKDWFTQELANGSSIKGLIDYYINTTYPVQIRPNGKKEFRILTYGDGATGQEGDLFLVSDNPYQANLANELARAYKLSYDSKYAAFLKLKRNYKADLINYPALPDSPLMPDAKSSIWPDFGLAFLRSIESAAYWHSPDAMAASLLFRQGYGHGHADALSMTLFAAGRLFYPDFNAIQYENPAIGWTANSVAHNTVIVEGANSSLAKSVHTFNDFGEQVKVVKADVSEAPGLEKKRTLALTQDYLLDVFHIKSLIPKTFDYVLHGFADIEFDERLNFKQSPPFSTRYKRINDFKIAQPKANWSIDFSHDIERELNHSEKLIGKFINNNRSHEALKKSFGIDSIDKFKAAKLKFEMAGDGPTQIGIGEDPYGLSFLAARRKGKKQTTFIATHSAYYVDDGTPKIQLTKLIDNKAGSLIKVSTDEHIDIHAISHNQGQTTLMDESSSTTLRFTDYAFIRVNKASGEIDQQGNWINYHFTAKLFNLNKDLKFGESAVINVANTQPLNDSVQVDVFPELVLLKNFTDTQFTLSLTNLTQKTISAALELQHDPNFLIPESQLQLGLISPYQTFNKKITLGRYTKETGIDVLPMTIKLDHLNELIEHGIKISVGPGLTEVYDNVSEPVYRINTFNPTIDFSMRHGLIKQIFDSTGESVYSGQNLFDLSIDDEFLSTPENKLETSYTWPDKEHASLITEINNLIRWHTQTIQDHFYIRLDDAYTRLDTVYFHFLKSNPSFVFNQARYISNGQTKDLTDNDSSELNISAVEIPLEKSAYSLCIKTTGSGHWLNSKKSLSLPLQRNKNEQWFFTLCKQGALTNWSR